MFQFLNLLHDHTDRNAESIVMENGKTLLDAKGDIFGDSEVVESSRFLPYMMGETLENWRRAGSRYFHVSAAT